MFFIYFLAFFAFIPILAYLLSQNTNNKGYIFGISFLVFLVCLFTVVGKYSFLGSIKNQKINSEILMNINANNEISGNITREFNNNISNEDIVYWLQSYINKAIEDSKFIAAESLISISEQYFQTTDEKFIFYFKNNVCGLYLETMECIWNLFGLLVESVCLDRGAWPPSVRNPRAISCAIPALVRPTQTGETDGYESPIFSH